MTTPPERPRKPSHLAADRTLGQALHSYLDISRLSDRQALNRVLGSWPEVVGTAIAQQTQDLWLEGTTLCLRVASPTWRQELLLRQRELMDSINTYAGRTLVKGIRVF